MTIDWLICGETSGMLRNALRAEGLDAWSCDLLSSEDDSQYHIKMDMFTVVDLLSPRAAMFHPTCTWMCNSGVKWLYVNGKKVNGNDDHRWWKMFQSTDEFNRIIDLPIDKKIIENPIMHSHASSRLTEPYSQIVHPYFHGDPFFKQTCYWIDGFDNLRDTHRLVPPLPGTAEHKRWSKIHRMGAGANRWKERSRSFPGICAAQAKQWGPNI